MQQHFLFGAFPKKSLSELWRFRLVSRRFNSDILRFPVFRLQQPYREASRLTPIRRFTLFVPDTHFPISHILGS